MRLHHGHRCKKPPGLSACSTAARRQIRVKDNGETQGITAALHASASLSAQERPRYQTLPELTGEKKRSSFSLTFPLAACQGFRINSCMDFQTF